MLSVPARVLLCVAGESYRAPEDVSCIVQIRWRSRGLTPAIIVADASNFLPQFVGTFKSDLRGFVGIIVRKPGREQNRGHDGKCLLVCHDELG